MMIKQIKEHGQRRITDLEVILEEQRVFKLTVGT